MKQNGGQLANLRGFEPSFRHSGEPSDILANLHTFWRTFTHSGEPSNILANLQTVPANHVARMLIKPMENEAKWRSAGQPASIRANLQTFF